MDDYVERLKGLRASLIGTIGNLLDNKQYNAPLLDALNRLLANVDSILNS